jgi:hypothetical protein
MAKQQTLAAGGSWRPRTGTAMTGEVVSWEGTTGWVRPNLETGHLIRLPASNTPGNVVLAVGTKIQFSMGKRWDARRVRVLEGEGTAEGAAESRVSDAV